MSRAPARRNETALAPPDEIRAWLEETRDIKEIRRMEGRVNKFAEVLRREDETREHAAEFMRLRNDIARRGGELLAASIDKHPGKKVGDGLSLTLGLDSEDAAKAVSSRWQRIFSLADDIYAKYQARDEPYQAGLLKLAKVAKERAARESDDVAEPTPGVFPTIAIDPPWRYDNKATRGAAEDHYETMSLDDLAGVFELMHQQVGYEPADNAHLYLWVTNGFLREGFELLDKWGFTYKACLTWCKPQIGTGNYFRNATEHIYFAIRGSLPTNANNIPTWFTANRTQHSAKPQQFYDIVEKSSPGPYLDMFARARRLGDWSVWGNQALAECAHLRRTS